MKKTIIYIFIIGIILVAGMFFVSSLLIGNSVKDTCQISQSKYEGDCVGSLIVFVDDENNSFRERNRAIWALGQIGDERGLIVLEKNYTGVEKDREPLDEDLSQYELEKAIKWIKTGNNLTALVWRGN